MMAEVNWGVFLASFPPQPKSASVQGCTFHVLGRSTMLFSNFKTTEEVQRIYGITAVDGAFVGNSGLSPSPEFRTLFEFDMAHIDVRDEAARRETVIYPILREAFRHHTEQLSLFSHRLLVADEQLSGIADYFIAKRSILGRNVLEWPILVIAEAKRDDFEQGWAQCLAEMIAAQRLNDDESIPMYGIVTNGDIWEFGVLAGHDWMREPGAYTLRDLQEVLGAVDFIFTEAKQALNKSLSWPWAPNRMRKTRARISAFLSRG